MDETIDRHGLGVVHLAVRSHYSTGQAAATTKEIVKRAKAIGARCVGLMDEESMSGGLDFAMACNAAGLKPIVGMRVRLKMAGALLARIGLVATTETGLVNLNRLTAIMHRRAPAAQLTAVEIRDHSDGLIMLTGNTMDGLPARLIGSAGENTAAIALNWFADIFKDRLFVEIERPGDLETEQAILRIAEGGFPVTGPNGAAMLTAPALPIIATTDIRYTTPEKHLAWAVIDADRRNRKISIDRVDATPNERRFYMRTADEMQALFADLPEALVNAGNLAVMANAAPRRAPVSLPRWPDLKPGETEDGVLRRMSEEGLAQRFVDFRVPQDRQAEYRDRLEYELSVISRMGFSGYFMMVSDFVNFARRSDIPVGPGRGSGAGSLVAWAIGITRPDPIRYGLLFERFLNPDRVSMPDFDVDFCGDKRAIVMDYIRQRYGTSRVANIATFGEVRAKKGLKTVQRILTNAAGGELSYAEGNKLSSQLPGDKAVLNFIKEYNQSDRVRGGGEPLDEVVNLRNIVRASKVLHTELNDTARRIQEARKQGVDLRSIKLDIFRAAQQAEGYYNVAGAHAAGLAITASDLTDRIPMLPDRAPGRTGELVCGYDMKYAELAGLVKFDILGLRTATMIGAASTNIRANVKDFDIETIPVDDPAVMENFRRGLTSGIFQFESAGMRNALKQVAPTSLLDLSAAVALYRPGPMDNIPSFGARKRGEEKFEFYAPADKTSAILGETYGIIVYQEQVMQIAQVCAGFSLAAADLMRRAMGKKNAEEMAALKTVFVHGDEARNIPGAVKLGMQEADAVHLYEVIAKFADYGFNKSHALAYATIAYQTMWLKTHYPAEFIAAAISIEMSTSQKKFGRDVGRDNIMMLRREAQALGVEIAMPDINLSDFECTPHGRTVRLGFGILKGVSSLPPEFIQMRVERPFAGIDDFFDRCMTVIVKSETASGKETKRTGLFRANQVEAMIQAGMFDAMEPNRRLVADQFKALKALRSAKSKKARDAVEYPVFAEPWLDEDRREFVATGMYLKNHPIERVAPRLRRAGVVEMEHIRHAVAMGAPSGMPRVRVVALPYDTVERTAKTSGNQYSVVRFGARTMDWDAHLYPPRRGESADRHAAMKALIEQAKANHQALVVDCSISFEGDAEGGMRSRIVINHVAPAADLLAQVERFDSRIGIIRAEDTETADEAAQRVIRRMSGMRADGHASAVAFTIRKEAPGYSETVRLDGLYLLEGDFDLRVRSHFYDILIEPNDPNRATRAAIMSGALKAASASHAHHAAAAGEQAPEREDSLPRAAYGHPGRRRMMVPSLAKPSTGKAVEPEALPDESPPAMALGF
ncbi:DNA polymerase III subunit alpha [Acidiphilium sp. C61]|uniref:DNA polymerase III subunit alpha n=1 Tax=Acidiphilium sp. C61 TaxID=1671485 RepID=UPI00157B7FFE|nr:DNA polymerase III subunit alpha [Acidiphilium sp. C61]